MKKLALVVAILGLFSVQAHAVTESSITGIIGKTSIPLTIVAAAFTADGPKACDSKPYRTVRRKNSNYFFDVSECTFQANKSQYVEK